MEIWDRITKKVSNVASKTAKGTEKYTELTKVKFNLMREKIMLEELYKKLGELYYKQMKTSEIDEEAVSLTYDKIEKTIVGIENLTAQINVLKNTKICSECGIKLEKGMEFCYKCGAKQAVEVTETEKVEETEAEQTDAE